jgi:TonB family protein
MSGMRKGIVLSLAAHALAMILVFVSVSFNQVTYTPRETYRVRLVSPAAAAQQVTQVTPPAPAPAPKEPPKEEPKEEPKDEELVTPVKKPNPKPAEKKGKEVPRTEIAKGSDSTGAASDTSASAGAVSGGISFDGGDFPYDAFIARMRQKIAAVWQVPAGSEGVERFAVVYFRVHRDGHITNVAVEQASGVFLFDQSCQRAVLKAAPFPPLPREYADDYVGVHFSFKYVPTQ